MKGIPVTRRSRLHAVWLEQQGHQRLELDGVVGDEAHLPAVRQGGEHQAGFEPGERLANADAWAAAEGEVGEELWYHSRIVEAFHTRPAEPDGARSHDDEVIS